MIIASILVFVLLIWAFDLIRNIARWILPPAIAVVLALWFSYSCQLGGVTHGFYNLLLKANISGPMFVDAIPYIVLYCLIITFLHCFRRQS